MIRNFLIIAAVIAGCFSARSQLTLESCMEKAEANYPLIKQYALLEQTLDIDLSDINKSWLPKISLYGQATIQNSVPSFPKALSGVLQSMGQHMEGLSKFQYKAGVDISQTIWDGGASKARRRIAESREASQRAALDVELYSVRERVRNLYFSVLFTEEQIEQNLLTASLLESNLNRLTAMLRNGVAMQSDVDMVEAHLLSLRQGITQARSAVKGYRRILGLFIGEEIPEKSLLLSVPAPPGNLESARPELTLFDKQTEAAMQMQKLNEASLMPKIGFFTQAYYGYPGFNYFKSMMSRNLSFNILAGVKAVWEIDALYTKKNNSLKTQLSLEQIASNRETFLFNSRLQQAGESEAIEGLKEMMKDDARITALYGNARKAAESQLENGVIDTQTLLSRITDENIAKLNAKLHEYQYLQEIYKLKYTLNR